MEDFDTKIQLHETVKEMENKGLSISRAKDLALCFGLNMNDIFVRASIVVRMITPSSVYFSDIDSVRKFRILKLIKIALMMHFKDNLDDVKNWLNTEHALISVPPITLLGSTNELKVLWNLFYINRAQALLSA
jgi:hypothetical protein